MNVFYLSTDPVDCAQQHCDKHVVKMIVESAQLLSTAHRVVDGRLVDKNWVHPSLDAVLYRASHVMHPTNVWVRQSLDHYSYLWALFCALHAEYSWRYRRVHSTFARLSGVLVTPPLGLSELRGFVEPPQCMPEEYRRASAVEGYRTFYACDKVRFATYTRRHVPGWLLPALEARHAETNFKYQR